MHEASFSSTSAGSALSSVEFHSFANRHELEALGESANPASTGQCFDAVGWVAGRVSGL